MIIALEEARRALIGLRDTLRDLGVALRIEELRDKSEELEAQTMTENFWSDAQASSKVLQSIKQMKGKIELFESLCSRLEDAVTLAEMGIEEGDESVTEEVESELAYISEEAEKQRLETLLTGEYDRHTAILSFHPGAGGTEAQDWAMMLYRMYTRWGERHG